MSLITGGQHTDKWYNLNRVSPKICRWSISMWIGSSGSLGSNTSKDVESSKFSFWCCHSGRRVTYGGKMIEFLCKVEPRQQPPPGPEQFQWSKTKSGRNSPRTQDWRENTSNMPGKTQDCRERLASWEYFKYAGKGVASLFSRANSPSGWCLQTPQVGLERKSFYALPNQIEPSTAPSVIRRLPLKTWEMKREYF